MTALNSSTSSGGAQLTDYSLTTAPVDTSTLVLSGEHIYIANTPALAYTMGFDIKLLRKNVSATAQTAQAQALPLCRGNNTQHICSICMSGVMPALQMFDLHIRALCGLRFCDRTVGLLAELSFMYMHKPYQVHEPPINPSGSTQNNPVCDMPDTHDTEDYQPSGFALIVIVGLLANRTCIQAELYQMQEAMSGGVNPLWVVPYTTLSAGYKSSWMILLRMHR